MFNWQSNRTLVFLTISTSQLLLFYTNDPVSRLWLVLPVRVPLDSEPPLRSTQSHRQIRNFGIIEYSKEETPLDTYFFQRCEFSWSYPTENPTLCITIVTYGFCPWEVNLPLSPFTNRYIFPRVLLYFVTVPLKDTRTVCLFPFFQNSRMLLD